MAKPTKTETALTDAGFTILRKRANGRWFKVVAPDGSKGWVLRQSMTCWHFFDDSGATASHADVARCHQGGLGDAIGTESQTRTYERLVLEAPRAAMANEAVYASSSGVFNDNPSLARRLGLR